MKKLFIPLLSIFIASTAFTINQNAVMRSAITFKIKNLGINTSGSIGGLKATVKFNPADLTASTLDATVDVNTINTDNATRDEHLKSDSYFDTEHFPKISLKSVSFKHKSGDNYTGQFNLTIKDKTKLIEIPFTFTEKGSVMVFTGMFKLNRLDYSVGGNSMILANEVTIKIDSEAGK